VTATADARPRRRVGALRQRDAPPAAGRVGRRRPRGWWTGYLFIAPFFLLFAAFGAYPLVYALELSFSDWHGAGALHWIGVSNYTYLLTSSDFWASVGVSVTLWLLIVPAQTVGSIALATLLSRSRLRFIPLLRTTVLLPYVTPLAAMAQAFILLFDRDFGVVNAIGRHLGLPAIGWLTTTTWAKATIALFVLWKSTGFALVVMLAAVQAIPGEVYEAAAIDGAGTAATFTRITVPLMRPAIAFFVVVSTLGVSQLFLEPYVITRGGPYNSTTTSGLYLFQHIGNSDLGTGAANSFLLVVGVLLLSVGAIRLLRARDT